MSSDSEESEVQQFYADATMPEDRIDALLSHGHSVADARLWKRVAVASTLGLAGMILLCVGLAVRLRDRSQTIAAPTEPPVQVMEQPAAPASDPTDDITPDGQGFRLIAVRSHGDQCPHCRASGETFAKLRKLLADKSIQFTFLDLRKNSESMEESQRQFDSLELNNLVEGRDKALIALADPAGILHKLDTSDSPDQLVRHISGMLGGK